MTSLHTLNACNPSLITDLDVALRCLELGSDPNYAEHHDSLNL
jgi:hypothetical protein